MRHEKSIRSLCQLNGYRKFPKYSDTQIFCCNHPKFSTMWLYNSVMSPNNADGMGKSVDPDQTAPVGAVWSGCALFALHCLPENLGSLRYLIIIILHKRILIKLCQICLSSAVRNVRNIGKLIFYAGSEYKILHRQFFDGNTLQNSFFNKKVVSFHKKVEGSEIVGLKIFHSNSQANMIFITYTLFKMSS